MTDSLRALVDRLGGSYHGSYVTLPGPGHSRHDRSLSVKEGAGGRLVYFSHAGDSHRNVQAYLGVDSAPLRDATGAAPARRGRMDEERLAKLRFCETLWRQAREIGEDDAAVYLHHTRGVTWRGGDALRFHPECPRSYPWSGTGGPPAPAMLGLVRDSREAATGLHATFLRDGGAAKDGRIMFGLVHGGAVRLAPVNVLGQMGLGEGIETCLAFAELYDLPTWAALSASGIASFEPPRGVRRITVCADSDDRGVSVRDARKLAERLRRRCDVIITAAPEGQDWHDVLKERARG